MDKDKQREIECKIDELYDRLIYWIDDVGKNDPDAPKRIRAINNEITFLERKLNNDN